MAIIEVKNVTKNFGPKVALDNVSLDIPEGKIFGLLAETGDRRELSVGIRLNQACDACTLVQSENRKFHHVTLPFLHLR